MITRPATYVRIHNLNDRCNRSHDNVFYQVLEHNQNWSHIEHEHRIWVPLEPKNSKLTGHSYTTSYHVLHFSAVFTSVFHNTRFRNIRKLSIKTSTNKEKRFKLEIAAIICTIWKDRSMQQSTKMDPTPCHCILY